MHRVANLGGWKKYHNKRTEVNGIHYDSKLESKVGWELDLRLKSGDIKSVQRQVTFAFVVNGIKITTYRADFVIENNDGTKEVVEAKGFLTDVGRIKILLFEALYVPEYKLTIVRQ